MSATHPTKAIPTQSISGSLCLGIRGGVEDIGELYGLSDKSFLAGIHGEGNITILTVIWAYGYPIDTRFFPTNYGATTWASTKQASPKPE